MSDTFEITDSIKALAILSVVIGHYFNRYISIDVSSFANGFIAVFFILSGYGLYFSFSKYDSLSTKNTINFFKKRAKRIYPLFWLSSTISIVLALVFSLDSPILMLLENPALIPVQLSGIPIFSKAGIPWFVYAIIFCYLGAPLMFKALKKYGALKYMSITFCIIGLANIIVLGFKIQNPQFMEYAIGILSYRYMFLGQNLLFSIGLALPPS